MPVLPRRLLLIVLALIGLGLPAGATVSFDWVTVGDPGNACDVQPNQGCFGSVDYAYRISKYEVTNAQYVEFLNAKAASDSLGLYNTNMGLDPANLGGIIRNGSSGSYTYQVIEGRENKPVNYVSFYDALRFVNWLHNGQGSGDTETGAYTLSDGLTVSRNGGANIFLTSEDEWYKAAYYDALSASYFDFPTGTDTQIVCALPGPTPNTANCGGSAPVGDLTDVGSYTGSASPYGTFDQGGNILEWHEDIKSGSRRGWRGGSTIQNDGGPNALSGGGQALPDAEDFFVGFRVAMPIPEPGTGLLLTSGLAWLAVRRRSRSASL